jgi:ferritin
MTKKQKIEMARMILNHIEWAVNDRVEEKDIMESCVNAANEIGKHYTKVLKISSNLPVRRSKLPSEKGRKDEKVGFKNGTK